MVTYKLKWTKLQSEIFRLFCIKTGQVLNLRQVAKELDVTPTAVSKAIQELKKQEFLKVISSSTMNLLSIEFNYDNYKAIQLKRVENLKTIYEYGLADFLYDEFPGCTIILFGSFSFGEDMNYGGRDKRNSDIDIAIIGRNEKKIDLSKLEKLFEKIINLNYYKSWKEIHKNLKENILRGIVLKGTVEL